MYYVLQRTDTAQFEGDMTFSKPNWVNNLDDAFEYQKGSTAHQQADFYRDYEELGITVVLVDDDITIEDKISYPKLRTWHMEMMIASTLLFAVLVFSGFTLPNVLTTLAGIAMFGYMQVMSRVTEDKNIQSIECHAWAIRYLITKETLWTIYFIAIRNWSALLSVALFITYPMWRSFYTRHKD